MDILQSSQIHLKTAVASIRRAFGEFLRMPTFIIVAFLLLAILTYVLDRAAWPWLSGPKNFLQAHIFSDVNGAGQLLRTIAGGLMTMTSVIVSILLLALQQSAAAMTTAVFDQFLRRRLNQAYFGFFVGLTLYSLITLATVNASFNPVISGATALSFTIVALFLLIVLLYTTINQIRPTEIIETIHDHTLAARRRQLDMLARTRRQSLYTGSAVRPVRAQQRGMIINIDVDAIAAAVAASEQIGEVTILKPVGRYVAFQDTIAQVQAGNETAALAIAERVEAAVEIGRKRDITTDPEYGIEQLTTIAWSSISSAKSDISPGLLTIYSLRNILARWSMETTEREQAADDSGQSVPIVYPDEAFTQLLNALEALAVISSESMQYQAFAEVLSVFADLFDRLPEAQQEYAEQLILRLLAALGDHVLTAKLDQTLDALTATLYAAERSASGDAVAQAQADLNRSVGKLHSRTTRAGFGWGQAVREG